MSTRITKNDIDKLVDRSVQHLIEEYREISNSSGWHQYLGSEKIGNIANAQALLIFQYFNKQFSNKYKVLETLKTTQFKESKKTETHGGWTYQTNHTSTPTTECTCWTLFALHSELDRDDKTIQNGLTWILNNHQDKNKDIGWGSIREDKSRTYATCLALRTLKKFGKHKTEQFQRAINWLKFAKNIDGGWGDTEKHGSTITHTAHAIITLIECGLTKESAIVKSACDWLIKQYEDCEKWIDIQNGGLLELLDFEGKRISYYHYSLPWVLVALIQCDKLNTPEFFKSFKELIDNEDKGNWIHPYLLNQKHYTIWSKHDSLLAINQLKKLCPNWDALKLIQLKKNTVSFIHNNDKPRFFRIFENVFITKENKSENKFSQSKKIPWWIIAVIGGVFAIIIKIILNIKSSWIDEFLIGITVTIILLLFNPIRRYYKAFWTTITLISSLAIIPAFDLKTNINIESLDRVEKIFFNLIIKDPHWVLYVVLGLIAIGCLALDYFERRQLE